MHAAPGVHEHAAAICEARLQPGARILELGAGSGALAARLRNAGFQVTATDLEPSHPEIQRLDLDNLQHTEFVDTRPDMIVCIETMEHLENPRAALRSMRTLLPEGAELLISTPNVMHPHSRLRTLLTGEPALFGVDAYYETGHITPLPDWLLLEHLRSSGFDPVLVNYAGGVGIKSRWRLIMHRLEIRLLAIAGIRQSRDGGDGTCLFVAAKAV